MNRATALQLLPTAYATALGLQDRGASHATIARELDVALQAVPRLLELGASKLDAILARQNPMHGASGPALTPPG
jgi:DNA-directed RNA polymerase specialized sigma24 family protein